MNPKRDFGSSDQQRRDETRVPTRRTSSDVENSKETNMTKIRYGTSSAVAVLPKLLLAMLMALCFAMSVARAAEIQGIKDPARGAYYDVFKGKKVVFVPVFMGLALTETWSQIMANQAKRLGYDYEVRNANFNTAAGTQILTSLIHAKDKPDVLLVHNPDVTSYSRLLEEAEKAGIFVIQVNMKSLYTTDGFAGGDATKIGEMEANAAVQHCGQNTNTSHKVLVITGPTTAPWSVYINEGLKKAIAKDHSINVVSVQSDGNYEADKDREITSIALQQHPDLCAVVDIWDVPAIGAASAIEHANLKGKVFLVTNGGGNDAVGCTNIRNGNFSYYVSFDVPGQARDLNDLIQMVLEEKAAGKAPGSTKIMLYSPLKALTKGTLTPRDCWSLKEFQ